LGGKEENKDSSGVNSPPIEPVWVPATAPSPSTQRKYKPVTFQVPDSPKSVRAS